MVFLHDSMDLLRFCLNNVGLQKSAAFPGRTVSRKCTLVPFGAIISRKKSLQRGTSAGIAVCQKSLAEFRRRSGEIELDHFLPGRVPGGKFFSGCKCASCAPSAHKECAQQTAALLSEKPAGVFDSLKSLRRGTSAGIGWVIPGRRPWRRGQASSVHSRIFSPMRLRTSSASSAGFKFWYSS